MSGFEEGKPRFEGRAPARAKLFKHGGSQAVRLPKAFRFEGDEVSITREGDRVILEPVRQAKASPPRTDREWKAFWARIDELAQGDFPEREQPPMQEREFW